MKTSQQLIQGRLYSFDEYYSLFEELVSSESTTGPNKSESMVHYTKLNLSRMKRWMKSIELNQELIKEVEAIQSPQIWTVITESWCGDAAHILPWLNAIAERNELIELRIVLRDENPELMDQFLTDGIARSIPILIAEKTTGEYLYHWGPRPYSAQSMMIQAKKDQTPYSELSLALQKWYNANKGFEIQEELSKKLAASA